MKPAARPVLTALQRGFAAQAARATQAAAEAGPRISRLPNGVVVASVENHSPVSRVAVLYNAGSRFEGRSNEGITHCIRSMANLSSTKSTGFNLIRNLQQIGSNVECATTREHVIYSMDCTRNHLDVGLEFLGYMTMSPAFKSWEVRDHKPALQLDMAILEMDPTTRVMEGLHTAAFRDGLGRSLYMPPHSVGSHTPEQLADFVSKHYQPGNMAIVGVGVDHEAFLYRLQHQLGFPRDSTAAGPVQPGKATYHGGEVRMSNNSPFVHAAVATQGVSLGSKDMIPAALLQNLMGTGPRIKYSTAPNAKINQAIAQATSNPFAASTLNLNYSDAGLFGFYVVMQASDAGKVLPSVVSHFSNATKAAFSDQEITRAKSQLKASVLYELENSSSAVQDLGTQVLLTGQVLSPENIVDSIDKVTAADIQAVAKKMINGKPTMCAVGDLSHTPYVDQLL